jgi:phage-related minor tail protein
LNAKGAILNGAQLFGMTGNTLLGGGEAGREAVLPLESNTGWMDKIADKVVSRMGSSEGEQTINVTVTLDRQVVGKTVVKYINGERNRTGKSPVLI